MASAPGLARRSPPACITRSAWPAGWPGASPRRPTTPWYTVVWSSIKRCDSPDQAPTPPRPARPGPTRPEGRQRGQRGQAPGFARPQRRSASVCGYRCARNSSHSGSESVTPQSCCCVSGRYYCYCCCCCYTTASLPFACSIPPGGHWRPCGGDVDCL